MEQLTSQSFDRWYTCPRRARLSNWSMFDAWPDGVLKSVLDDYLVKKSRYKINAAEHTKKSRPILEPTGHPEHGLRFMMNWLGGRSDNIIGMNITLPIAISGKPVDVQVPYIIRSSGVMYFIWPLFTEKEIELSDIFAHPAICCMSLLAYREDQLDPSARYYACILTENKIYAIRNMPKSRNLIKDYIDTFVGGLNDKTETAIPGTHCQACPVRNTCTFDKGRIDAIPKEEILLVSGGKTGQTIVPINRPPKVRVNRRLRQYSSGISTTD